MDPQQRHFPKSAGVLFGLGLGGFFDGIVLHQLLQWHHMLSNWYPITSIEALELNTLWMASFIAPIFHSATYLFVVTGLLSCGAARSGGIFTGQASCWQERCCWALASLTP